MIIRGKKMIFPRKKCKCGEIFYPLNEKSKLCVVCSVRKDIRRDMRKHKRSLENVD